MSDFPRMIYKVGDQEEMHGGRFNYMIVDDQPALEAMVSMGWYMTTTEAREAASKPVKKLIDDNAPPTRQELEIKATELGIKFDGRTNDRKLNALINEKLAA